MARTVAPITGYFYAPNAIFDDIRLTASALLVYVVLCRRANAQGESWPSIATLAKDTRLARNTIRDAITLLVKHDYVQVTARKDAHGRDRSTLYRLEGGQVATTRGQSAATRKGSSGGSDDCHQGSNGSQGRGQSAATKDSSERRKKTRRAERAEQSESEPEPTTSKPPTTRNRTPGQQAVAAFLDASLEARGLPYSLASRDKRELREIIEALGGDLERFKALLPEFFALEDRWVDANGYNVLVLRHRWQKCDALAQNKLKAAVRKREQDASSDPAEVPQSDKTKDALDRGGF